jgi:N-acetylneuraminic acid mutarotase/fibronectin type 3 domain-containing protein
MKRYLFVAFLLVNLAACGPTESQQPPPPAAPANLTPQAGDQQVILSWNPSEGATGYNVYRSEDPEVGVRAENRRNPALVQDTTFTDADVENGQTYYYVVTAVGEGGESAASDEVEATPQEGAVPPDAPQGLAAAAGDGQVVLSWQASAGASGYNVYRSDSPNVTLDADNRQNATLVQTTTFTDTNVENGVTYYYIVTAVGEGGESAASEVVEATPLEGAVPPPDAPQGLSVEAGDGQVVLSWQASTGASGYNVYRSETQNVEVNADNRLNATPLQATTFTDTNVASGATYYYVVTAVGPGGESSASNEASIALDPDPEQRGAWRSLPASAKNRQEVSYVQLDGKLYLTGGLGEGDTLHEVYDPVAGTWTSVAPLPEKLDHIQGVALNGRIYYIGGLANFPGPYSSSVYIYNPETDSFSEGTPMPRGRGAGGVAAHDGKIYYAGGLHDRQAVAWFDVYDPDTDSWQELEDMPEVRDHFHAVVLDGLFYAIAGRDTQINAVTAAVDVYDFATGEWTRLDTELPTPRGGFAAAVLGDEILIIGGEGGGNTYEEVDAYHPATNSWRELAPMITPRHGIQAAVCNGGVYIAAGGKTQGGNDPSNAHEVFFMGTERPCEPDEPEDFSIVQWSQASQAPQGLAEAQGAAVDGKLYVFGGYTSWSPLTVSDQGHVYDPATNTWSTLPTAMPERLTHGGTAVDGRDIYIAGGYPGRDPTGQTFSTTNVWKYNVDSASWTAMPSLPEARGAGAMVRLGRTLHFFGGANAGRQDASDHWTLDLDGGSAWQEAEPLPTARNHLGAMVLDGKIYAIGGQQGQDHNAVYFDTVEVFDPQTGSWSTAASLPQVRSHITEATFVMEGRIFVIGGDRAHTVAENSVFAYSPRSDSWTSLTPLPARREAGVGNVIDGTIYYTTGGGGLSRATYRGVPLR